MLSVEDPNAKDVGGAQLLVLELDNGYTGFFGPIHPQITDHDFVAAMVIVEMRATKSSFASLREVIDECRLKLNPDVNRCLCAVDIAMWDAVFNYQFASGRDEVFENSQSIGDPYLTLFGMEKSEICGLTPSLQKWWGVKLGVFGYNQRIGKLSIELLKDAIDTVSSARRVMLDAFSSLDLSEAIMIAERIGDSDVSWLEDPFPLCSIAHYKELRRISEIPICVGEVCCRPNDVIPLLDEGVVDYLHPEMSKGGGLSAISEWSALADTYDVDLVLHGHSLTACRMAEMLYGCDIVKTYEIHVPLLEQRTWFLDGYKASPTDDPLLRLEFPSWDRPRLKRGLEKSNEIEWNFNSNMQVKFQ